MNWKPETEAAIIREWHGDNGQCVMQKVLINQRVTIENVNMLIYKDFLPISIARL